MEKQVRVRLGTVLLGKYRLDCVLGMGGMAAVYKATHRNNAELAVKILHHELSVREDVRARFLREGYTANSVKHSGVVLVVDDDVAEDGSAFLVMELLHGAGVAELWEHCGRRMPLGAALGLADQLLDVLSVAHAHGIVHRDVKPSNLFVMRDATLKVLDFGIARALDEALVGDRTGAGIVLGTPGFMPPEQALGKSSEIDGQTDVWAVGATLFSLLSGAEVHEADTAQEQIVKAATQPARSLATAALEVPAPIADVVDHALQFEKAARWQSAEQMRRALQQAWQAHSGEAPSRAHLSALLFQVRDATRCTAKQADTLAAPPTPRATPVVPGGSRSPAERKVKPSDAVLDLVKHLFTSQGYVPPVLPGVARELYRISRSPNVAFAQIEKLLMQDPMLAARVLRVAQSVLYRRTVPVRTLKEAAVRLGLRALSDLFFQVAMVARVFDAKGFEEPMAALRRHSIATAHAAQAVSRFTSIIADHLFLCGLLHDIGAVAALIALSQSKPDDVSGLRGLSFDALTDAVHLCHEPAAAIVAAAWELPAEIKAVIERHHNAIVGGHPNPILSAVIVAEHIAARCGHPGLDKPVPAALALAFKTLGFTSATLELAHADAAKAIASNVD